MQKPSSGIFVFSWFVPTGVSRPPGPTRNSKERDPAHPRPNVDAKARLFLRAGRHPGVADFVDTQPDWKNHD